MMISEPKDAIQKKEEVQGNGDTKPGKLLRCPTEGCGKVFRSSPGYRYHLKSHDIDPRPHVCQCCQKKFKSANGLKYHLRKAHHIEPVLAKQNLGGGTTSPKSRESISSEEDPYGSLDTFPRNFLNGYSSVPSPLVKSPLGLSSPLLKNLPGIPSPLIKSPMDMGPYSSGGSTGSVLQSPYTNKDRYSHYYDKFGSDNRNGTYARRPSTDFLRQGVRELNSNYHSRSSLSEYTQQCQQANYEFRQQCQRLSTGDLSSPQLPPKSEYGGTPSQRSSCEYYNCHKSDSSQNSGSFSSDYHRGAPDCDYTCINDDKMLNSEREREYNSLKDIAAVGDSKEFTNDVICPNSISNGRGRYVPHSSYSTSCNGIKEEPVFVMKPLDSVQFKIPCSVQNTEQIVPDISTQSCISPTATSCDGNNNQILKSLRGASESSNETELSDCVFQNENSNPPLSPTSKAVPMISLSSTVKKEHLKETISEAANLPPPSKPLLSRRTSRSKSIPPALVINPSPTFTTELKPKDLSKMDPASRLRHLAEIATSPRSPFRHSPLPLTLTPSMLPGENTPDWIKSPSKFSFPDKPSFLLTPTISRCNVDTSHTDSMLTSTSSSPFLENIQTPSFWPTQMWPTPVWLCFLKGCNVKFEQDDKSFMTTEDVAAYCTTPGGRRRDDMNFYTSGMKIILMKDKPSINSARDMVELTFEQIIPGTQRLVAKCAVDHPFYVKHKGWSASNPNDAMARYGIPFRPLQKNDTVVQPPSKSNQTPCNTLSPSLSSSRGPEIFTFSAQDTSRFSESKKPELMLPPACIPDEKPNIPSLVTTSPSKKQETITLTYTSKSADTSQLSFYQSKEPVSQMRLKNELKSISDAMKNKAKENDALHNQEKTLENLSNNAQTVDSTQSLNNNNIESAKKVSPPRKKRRKPAQGNEKDRRPMNGFMLFAKEMRVELTKLFPGKDNRAISKLLGERWRELSDGRREDYSRMAKEIADERMKLNPDCWKRKHKKEKDGGGSKSSTGDAENLDCKKIKLESPDQETIPAQSFNNMTRAIPVEDDSSRHSFNGT